jgi:hypothetical protein
MLAPRVLSDLPFYYLCYLCGSIVQAGVPEDISPPDMDAVNAHVKERETANISS